ncbi:MAG TPA: sulfotransferase [Rhizomicrobium sp.]|nr:sulfotransferase [Rhizomicrobium sp.]
MRAPKVFGIGFQKTGTSSLDAAVRLLGYCADGGVFINTPNKKSSLWIAPPLTNAKVLERVLPIAREKEAFSDNPWPLLYRELESLFPDSKFVLTVREPQRWLQSLVRHFGGSESDMLEWLYGVRSVAGNEARCLQIYEAHNSAVREHFAARPNALLELDIEKEPRWNELCAFLGKPVPQQPFPRANTGTERERKRAGVWRMLKRAARGA